MTEISISRVRRYKIVYDDKFICCEQLSVSTCQRITELTDLTSKRKTVKIGLTDNTTAYQTNPSPSPPCRTISVEVGSGLGEEKEICTVFFFEKSRSFPTYSANAE